MTQPFRTIFNFASSAFSRYTHSLIHSPLRTKMISSCLISMFGDTVCQKFIEKKSWEDFSFRRTLRQCSVSLLYTAPIWHLWFGILLPKIVKPLTYKPVRVATSVILDNTVYASYIITTGVFLLELLKTGSVETSVNNVQKKFVTMFWNSAQFWCTVSFINHTFLPMHYRVVFGNSCGVIWQIYMSYMVNAAKPNNELVGVPSGTAK